MDNYTVDTGDTQTIKRGVFPNGDGTFLALTFSDSKEFKTRQGAVRWLKARGLDENGNRIGE